MKVRLNKKCLANFGEEGFLSARPPASSSSSSSGPILTGPVSNVNNQRTTQHEGKGRKEGRSSELIKSANHTDWISLVSIATYGISRRKRDRPVCLFLSLSLHLELYTCMHVCMYACSSWCVCVPCSHRWSADGNRHSLGNGKYVHIRTAIAIRRISI